MIRDFVPGSEWVYFKLYMGEKSVDKVLVYAIKPLLQELKHKGIVDKFFFLRFSDAYFHLRLRFHLSDISKIGTLLSVFNKHILSYYAGNIIWNIQIDTYKREIERYGAENIDNIESLYCEDSINTLSFLEVIKDDSDKEELRWLGAIRYIDDILDHFGATMQEKYSLMNIAKTNFLSEFGLNSATYTKPINAKYRNDLPKIRAAIQMESDLFRLIHKNNQSLKAIVALLQNKDSLILDVIHLLMNRIFMFEPRKHEMVVYYYLSKYYESQISLINYNKTAP